jgi:hypothetical protein
MKLKILLAMILSGAVLSSGGAQSNTVYACVAASGAVRIVAAANSCAGGETPKEWAVMGPQGPVGPAGPEGPQGTPGVTPIENTEILGTVSIVTTSGVNLSGPIIGIESVVDLNEEDVNTLQGSFTIQVPVLRGLDLVKLAQVADIGSVSPTVTVMIALAGDVTFRVTPAAVNAPFKLVNAGIAGGQTVQEIKISGVTLPTYP